jgi:hypothetical protein
VVEHVGLNTWVPAFEAQFARTFRAVDMQATGIATNSPTLGSPRQLKARSTRFRGWRPFPGVGYILSSSFTPSGAYVYESPSSFVRAFEFATRPPAIGVPRIGLVDHRAFDEFVAALHEWHPVVVRRTGSDMIALALVTGSPDVSRPLAFGSCEFIPQPVPLQAVGLDTGAAEIDMTAYPGGLWFRSFTARRRWRPPGFRAR